MEWISVNQILPRNWVEVLVYPKPSDYCNTAEYDGKNWKYGEYIVGVGHEEHICRPTHWMPLPPNPA